MGRKTKKQIERLSKQRAKRKARQDSGDGETAYDAKRQKFRAEGMTNRVKVDEFGKPIIPEGWSDHRTLQEYIFIVEPTPFTRPEKLRRLR